MAIRDAGQARLADASAKRASMTKKKELFKHILTSVCSSTIIIGKRVEKL